MVAKEVICCSGTNGTILFKESMLHLYSHEDFN